MATALCYNKGCGQNYDPSTQRADDECCYHPGEPKFHDAYKIWTCCDQKSTDFTQFLSFKGCAKGQHNPVKPVKPEGDVNKVIEEPKEPEKPKQPELVRPADDTPFVCLPVKIRTNPNVQTETGLNSPAPIKCLNHGCGAQPPDTSPCQFHPGVPVFHEGSKYWSCCQRKTTDFDAFLNQQGCETGDHKWGSAFEKKQTNWRVDWFQTANDVTITIFAKNSQNIVAECNGVIVKVDVDGWLKQWTLFGIVKADGSSVTATPNKVEVVLKKAEQKQWSKLEF